MNIEIRPVDRAEAVDYLRVIPSAMGLPNWEPAPAAWHAGHGPWPPPAAPMSADALAADADTVVADGFRSQAAFVDGRLVGASAMLSLAITVPGARQVAMGGVTATAVTPTHRRRGLLRALMLAMFEDCRERGEFLAGLSASEGSIYGRYGFSPATFQTRWELDRAEARFRTEPAAGGGDLELVDAEAASAAWPALHERVRARRLGEVSARPGHWDGIGAATPGADGAARFLLHRDPAGVVDGAAVFRQPWSADPALVGTVQVDKFEAATPDAYAAMWRLLTDFDLTRRVVAGRRPVDEPLRWMLTNPRAVRVTRSSDNLWLRLLDVPAAMSARSYDADGSVVLELDDEVCPWNAGRWRLDGGPAGASCTSAANATADLAMSVTTLGSLYLGGVSPGNLAAAGLIREVRPGAVTEFGRMLRQDVLPHTPWAFRQSPENTGVAQLHPAR